MQRGGGGDATATVVRDEAKFAEFARFELLSYGWTGIAVNLCVFGVLVHINLNFIVGVSIMFVGVVYAVVGIAGESSWLLFGDVDMRRHLARRRIVTIVKFALVVVFAAFAVWAGVIMLQRSL
jgi:uncharacterized membrane protein YuzA (DUF378 family)